MKLSELEADKAVEKESDASADILAVPQRFSPRRSSDAIMPQDFVTQNKRRFDSQYNLGKKLGAGTFGAVWLCNSKSDGSERAVKIIPKFRLAETMRDVLINEISILKHLDHPNIIKMFEYFTDERFVYIVQDVCKGGELFDEISLRESFNEQDAALIISRILNCINYCHQHNVVHRDLKPENILLEEGRELDTIKIIDFGQARWFNPQQKLKRLSGTPYYVAPEVLEGSYTNKCDIWSIGVITYVLLCGSAPFDGDNSEEIYARVRSRQYSMQPVFSENAVTFIRAMLSPKEEDRPSASEALEFPFIKSAVAHLEEKVQTSFSRQTLDSLRSFNADYKLKQATYAYVVSQLLHKGEKDKLDNIFRAADKNNDNCLSREELRNCIKQHFDDNVFTSMVEFDAMFDKIDQDASGMIDYSEFITAAMESSQLLNRNRLRSAFQMFDINGDGSISKEEIKSVLSVCKSIDNEHIESLVATGDLNGDGVISFDEFETMMTIGALRRGTKRPLVTDS